MAFGAVIVIAIAFPVTDFAQGGISWSFVGLGVLLGLFGVVLPPLLFSLGIPVVGSRMGTILSSTELPTTMILSAIVVSEEVTRSEEHTSELQSRGHLVCRLLLENKMTIHTQTIPN